MRNPTAAPSVFANKSAAEGTRMGRYIWPASIAKLNTAAAPVVIPHLIRRL